MDSTKPQEIAGVLEQRAGGSAPTGQQLVFDPTTGQLVVTDQRSPDSVLVTQAADAGYFGSLR